MEGKSHKSWQPLKPQSLPVDPPAGAILRRRRLSSDSSNVDRKGKAVQASDTAIVPISGADSMDLGEIREVSKDPEGVFEIGVQEESTVSVEDSANESAPGGSTVTGSEASGDDELTIPFEVWGEKFDLFSFFKT